MFAVWGLGAGVVRISTPVACIVAVGLAAALSKAGSGAGRFLAAYATKMTKQRMDAGRPLNPLLPND
jgi:hypothetical protein